MKIKPSLYILSGILSMLILLTACDNKNKRAVIYSNDTIVEGSENTILIPMQAENGKWGYVNQKKEWVIDPQFLDVRMFKKGVATAYESQGKSGIINTKGEWVIQPKYEVIGPIDNGYFFAAYKDKPVMIIDQDENIAVDGLMEESLVQRFTENLVPVSKSITFDNERILVGFKNHKNEWVIKPQYITYTLFTDGYAVVGKPDSTQLVIDTLGNTILTIPKSIDRAAQYSEGMIPVRSNNKWGYMDIKGNIIIDFQFDNAYSFYSGIALVREDNINKIINNKGEIILSLPQYNRVDTLDGYIIVFSNEEPSSIGVMNKNGDILIPPIYPKLTYQGNNYFRVTDSSGRIYYIDTKGNKFIDKQ